MPLADRGIESDSRARDLRGRLRSGAQRKNRRPGAAHQDHRNADRSSGSRRRLEDPRDRRAPRADHAARTRCRRGARRYVQSESCSRGVHDRSRRLRRRLRQPAIRVGGRHPLGERHEQAMPLGKRSQRHQPIAASPRQRKRRSSCVRNGTSAPSVAARPKQRMPVERGWRQRVQRAEDGAGVGAPAAQTAPHRNPLLDLDREAGRPAASPR